MEIEVTKGLFVKVIPHKRFDFIMSTREVAKGYGCMEQKVRDLNKRYHKDLIEGKHYLKGKELLRSDSLLKVLPNQILWTKRGISRLGFFINTDRARVFRDWAEELTIQAKPQKGLVEDISSAITRNSSISSKVSVIKVNMIMREVCKIEDKELRMSIVEKLYEAESKY